MDNPGKAAISGTTSVSEVVKMITTDGEGNYNFPEGVELSEELKFAATAEKRRRDTQSEYTKTRLGLTALEAENARLKEELLKQKINFTPDQEELLEDLKVSDPEAWRQKLNEFENAALVAKQEAINNMSTEVKTSASKQFEVSLRSEVLATFNAEKQVGLTDELLANELPARISKKLQEGTISYEEYLQEGLDFLRTAKVIKEEPTMGDPNLNRVSGGKTPGNNDPEGSLTELYGKDIY